MSKIKVLINGCNGKMGQEVAKKIRVSTNMEVMAGIDREDLGDNFFPVYTDIFELKDENPDVIIDFSIPTASLKALKFAQDRKIPIVIATTGFSEEELNLIKQGGKIIPLFQSYNMSYSIFVMKKVSAELAKLLDGTDIEIVEMHHNRKIDSPSRNSFNDCRRN